MKAELLKSGFYVESSCICGGTFAEVFRSKDKSKPEKIYTYPHRQRYAVKRYGVYIKSGNSYEMVKALKELKII